MIEKVVLKFLNENMSVPAYMEEPEEQPERYLLIEKHPEEKETDCRRQLWRYSPMPQLWSRQQS